METFSALLAICAGNSPVPGDFPTQRPVTRSFDVFFDLCLNKKLSKQSWDWWFETLSCPLWRQVVSSIPAGSTIIYRFLCGFICVSLCQSIKIKPTNMYIASARAQFKINTHRCWNWHHVHSRQVVSCPVQPRARHWNCVFWRDFSGVKRTCWTTGGVASVWRSWVRSPPGPR